MKPLGSPSSRCRQTALELMERAAPEMVFVLPEGKHFLFKYNCERKLILKWNKKAGNVRQWRWLHAGKCGTDNVCTMLVPSYYICDRKACRYRQPFVYVHIRRGDVVWWVDTSSKELINNDTKKEKTKILESKAHIHAAPLQRCFLGVLSHIPVVYTHSNHWQTKNDRMRRNIMEKNLSGARKAQQEYKLFCYKRYFQQHSPQSLTFV